MWTILRDMLVVPALVWMAPLTGGDTSRDGGHGWAAACEDEGQNGRQAARPLTADSAPALRRHARALYP